MINGVRVCVTLTASPARHAGDKAYIEGDGENARAVMRR